MAFSLIHSGIRGERPDTARLARQDDWHRKRLALLFSQIIAVIVFRAGIVQSMTLNDSSSKPHNFITTKLAKVISANHS
ncbi:hypothetical protein [Musicola keenii]|uniref:hypothetical protein n=1 Tax=Musicola keenii TaxID=2884250 RepID=UPI00177E6B8E|nr:hypothetical protein [Musicola keenii]